MIKFALNNILFLFPRPVLSPKKVWSWSKSKIFYFDVDIFEQLTIDWCYFQLQGKPSVNRKDLGALTLAGPTCKIPVLDPLGVLHLESWQYITLLFQIWNLPNHCLCTEPAKVDQAKNCHKVTRCLQLG